MDGGTPTKDPPKRGPLIAARETAPTAPQQLELAEGMELKPQKQKSRMPSAPGRENRESVQPSGRAAHRWTVERRRKTRQNADR